MDALVEFFSQPFVLGLLLGLVFALIVLIRFVNLRLEFSRYKRLLSDKMEVEAEGVSRLKKENEKLKKEAENLRAQVQQLGQLPDRQVMRDLEILSRAEKRMNVTAPGFVAAWDGAKAEAARELEEEAAGRSLPKRVFGKIFGSGTTVQTGADAEEKKFLPDSDKAGE